MKEITEAIDAWTTSEFSAYTEKLWGYCELMNKKDQPMPVTIPGRDQVSLNDDYELITWIRLPGTITFGNDIEGNDWSFGLQRAIVHTANLRLIVAHKISIGEDFILDFLHAFPSNLSVGGFTIVSIDKSTISVDADHEVVYTTELGATVYERHRFDWNVYALTIPVQYVICDEEFRVTELDQFRILE